MNQKMKKLVLAAMFLAIGLVLPLLTGQIQQLGNRLLPMHIPVILCGLICGWQYGLIVGFITPLLRSTLFGMPVLFPEAMSMAFELATYGAMVGALYGKSKWKCTRALYRSMIMAMISGRVVWGIVMTILMGVTGAVFTMQIFIAKAMVNAIPGIILQLILIPSIMVALDKARLVPFTNHRKAEHVLVKQDKR